MNEKIKWLSWILIAALVLSLAPVSIASADTTDKQEYNLSEIVDSWQSLSDSRLNDYIGNNNDTDLFWFITGLSEQERELLLSKDTMLNNIISLDRDDGSVDKMQYYDWIMENGGEIRPMTFAMTRSVASTFTSKTGYCFYRFVDNNSGYIVRYKVTFTLDSTDNAESEYNNYTVGSVIYVTSGTNSNNTRLDEVTFKKQKTYMKKAATRHEVLGDGSAGELKDGEMIYPTAITPIFVLTIKVPKPEYTYGEWFTGGFTMNGEEQTLAEGSRFNFREYNWQGTGDSTFDNKVYHQEETDTLTSCVNILSCGFTVENTNSLGLAEGVPEVDTINIVYKHPTLNVDYYVNGGAISVTANNTTAANPVRRSVLYNNLYNETLGMPTPKALGFTRKGYSVVTGKEWRSLDGKTTWDEANLDYKATDILDFTDGTYFISQQKSVYVNWLANVYQVILDNQGADFSGTENAWYKYNTYATQTLEDGTVQYNYFYTTQSLATPLKSGYIIEKPTKEGYTFKGYYKEKNGQGTMYVNENGNFINKLWKKVGPHTLYALWEEKPPEFGTLVIQRNLAADDYYSSHGDATFVFKVTSEEGNVYYRTISFGAEDLPYAKAGVITLETECVLPVGEYTVEAMEVSRFENNLVSMSSGDITSAIAGEFVLDSDCEEVVALYGGGKTDWQRFSHNDLVVNSLEE